MKFEIVKSIKALIKEIRVILAENSLTSLCDILETFYGFIANSLKAKHQITSGVPVE